MGHGVIPLEAPKTDSYYGLSRQDVVALLPPPLGRVLDVGCGEGGAADPLRAAGASSIIGIELLEEPAERARGRYDDVVVGDALTAVDELDGRFDTILCYDVLEHLVDPGALLAKLLRRATPGGRVHVSVPNARHVSLLRDLIVRGTFGYAPVGHRDATHLRWFTRRDIVRLMEEQGWRIEGTAHSPLHATRHLDALLRGRVAEFLAGQWYVLGRSPQSSPSS
jgi:2-polyprenyl-3-methyl-5-hydroxy-6-metoxy-1,4-benzoquinol methylase